MADIKQATANRYKWGIQNHTFAGYFIDGLTTTINADIKEAKDGQGNVAAVAVYNQTKEREMEAYADSPEALPIPGAVIVPTSGGEAYMVTKASEIEKGEDFIRRTCSLKRWDANNLPAAPSS